MGCIMPAAEAGFYQNDPIREAEVWPARITKELFFRWSKTRMDIRPSLASDCLTNPLSATRN
jgi:hypothetical protein